MKLNLPRSVGLKSLVVLIALTLLVATPITYVLAQSSSTFTISSGVYPGAPSYTIWSESGTYYAKNAYGKIDYSGTNASYVINSALNTLTVGRTWQETVKLLEGNFIITTRLEVSSYTILEGPATLTWNGGVATATGIIHNSGAIGEKDYIEIRDLILDGNSLRGGIHFEGAHYSRISNNVILNSVAGDSTAAILWGPGSRNIIENNIILSCKSQAAIWLTSGGTEDTAHKETVIANNHIIEHEKRGILLELVYTKRNKVFGNHFITSMAGVNHIELLGASENLIYGNTMQTSQYGVYLTQSDSDQPIRNQIFNNNFFGLERGVSLNSASWNVINENIMRECTYGILEAGASDYNHFYMNVIDGATTAITKVGANTKVQFNRGFVTENSGEKVCTGTSQQTQAHGLAGDLVPNLISVVPIVTGITITNVWADATNIYFTLSGDATIEWSASVI